MKMPFGLIPVLVFACHAGPEASVADASPPSSRSAASEPAASAVAPTNGDAAASPSGTCSLSDDERRALEKCLWSLVSYRVGTHGTFGIRVKMTRDASGAVHASSRVDDEAWRDAPTGTCLVNLAQAFATDAGKPLPCSWAAKGPYPVWTLSAD